MAKVRFVIIALLSSVVACAFGLTTTVVECGAWESGTAVNVTVNSGDEVVLSGCIADGVNVTLQCGPGSSVVLVGWAATNAGWVALTGPEGESMLSDVEVCVNNSLIMAAAGPAVGIVAAGNAPTVLLNVTFKLWQSQLGSAAGFGIVGLTGAGANLNVTIENFIVMAWDVALSAVGDGSAVGLLGVGLVLTEGTGYLSLQNWTLSVVRVNVTVSGAFTACGALGLSVSGPGDWNSLSAQSLSTSIDGSYIFVNASGGSYGSAAVGGVALWGGSSLMLDLGGLRCVSNGSSVTMEVVGAGAALCATAVIYAQQVSVDGIIAVIDASNVGVTVSGNSGNIVAGAVGSLALYGSTTTASVSVVNALAILQWANVSVSTTGDGSGMASAVLGVACNKINGNVQMQQVYASVAQSTVSTGGSVASSILGTAGSEILTPSQNQLAVRVTDSMLESMSYGGVSSIFGIALAYGGYELTQQNDVTLSIAASNVSSCSNAGYAASSVAAIAIAAFPEGPYSDVTVTQQNIHLWIASSTVTCLAEGPQGSTTQAAAAVGGIAVYELFGPLVQQQAQMWFVDSVIASLVSASFSSGVSTVGGLVCNNCGASGPMSSLLPQTASNVQVWIGWSTVTTAAPSSVDECIGGVAAPVVSTQTQNSFTVWIGWSTLISSNVMGVSGGGSQQQQNDVTAWIGWCNISTGSGGAAVLGIFSTSGAAQQQNNVAAWIGWSNISTGSGGTAVLGLSPSSSTEQQQNNVSAWIGWSNISTGSGGTAVLGMTGSSCSVQQQNDVSAWIGWSNLSTGSGGTAVLGMTGASCSVQQQNNVTAWIGWSNISSCCDASMAVLGIAVSGASSTPVQDTITAWIGWSNIAGCTGGDSTSSGLATTVLGISAQFSSTSTATQTRLTAWVAWSNITQSTSASVCSVLGIATVNAGAFLLLDGLSAHIGWSNIACASTAAEEAASAILGIGAGQIISANATDAALWIYASSLNSSATVAAGGGSSQTVASVTVGIVGNTAGGSGCNAEQSNLTLGVVDGTLLAQSSGGGSAASAVGGIALSGTSKDSVLVQQWITVDFIRSTVVSSISAPQPSASAVLGIAAGCCGTQSIEATRAAIIASHVSSTGDGPSNGMAVTVSGIAAINSTAQSQKDSTTWVAWSNVNCSNNGSTAASPSIVAGAISQPTGPPSPQSNVSLLLACSVLICYSSAESFTYTAATPSAVLGLPNGSVSVGCPPFIGMVEDFHEIGLCCGKTLTRTLSTTATLTETLTATLTPLSITSTESPTATKTILPVQSPAPVNGSVATLTANLLDPFSYGPGCANVTTVDPRYGACFDGLQSCSSVVNYTVQPENSSSGGIAFTSLPGASSAAQVELCDGLLIVCVTAYVSCVQNLMKLSSSDGGACPWSAALHAYQQQTESNEGYTGSILQRDCTQFMITVLNVSGCGAVFSDGYVTSTVCASSAAPHREVTLLFIMIALLSAAFIAA